ncbi:hypothetical protein CG015_18115 [Vibrio anguillarum]|uniref:hypothetical protein n=4 Tax=Vibrio TaxID=662 RepID=UPI000B7BC711|nr:hypothetical protein [Vibrio anguillarum]ASO31075.1 hypothetical protein CG015_18115 [Vibrio anguillarum]GIA21099.1 hypothetical protein VCSRO13_3397 [Vibrio cholerae]HDI3326875.1 hypothetical protein [Vibrio cholerae]
MSEDKKKRDWIDVTETISKLIATIIIPVVIFFVGQSYTEAQVESQVRSEYIKMGVGLLAKEPNENNSEVRKWAIKLINHYSEVKFTPEAEKELEQSRFLLSLFNELSNVEKNVKFSWEPDGSVGYELEIQKLDNGVWQSHNGLCLTDTSTILSVPIDKKVRWRHGSTNNGKTVFSEWKDLPTEK